MAIMDRIRERIRGQRPIGAAEEMQQGYSMPGGEQGFGTQLPDLRGMNPGMPQERATWMDPVGAAMGLPMGVQRQQAGNRYGLQHNQMSEEQLESLQHGQTAEAHDAFLLGQRMGAESLLEMSGESIHGRGAGEDGRLMSRERLNSATNTLLRYRAGKSSVNKRIVSAQQWWKLKNWEQIKLERGTQGATEDPSNTGWLWNCIVGKHADMIDCYPEPIILPRMQDDKEEARKLSKIIPVVLEMNDFEETYNGVMWQKMQEGTGAYGVFWDQSKLNGLGDIDIEKVNVLNLYWEPGINDIQKSKNLFYVSYEDQADLIEQYPELQGKLQTSKLFIEKYKTDDSVDMTNKATVIDWYYKKRVGGRTVLHYCKYVSEFCIYSSEEADLENGYYEDGNYPFVMDGLFPVEGSPAAYGYIDVASDSQTDIDTISQAMVLNAAMRATPRYFEQQGVGINEKEFMNWRKMIVHTSGPFDQNRLRPVEVGAIGAEAFNMLQQKIDEIKFITGNTDVNNGGVPAGVTAASAIAALKEDSGRSSKDSTKASYRAYKKVVLMVIERIRQFYDIPRQFRILGQYGQQEFTEYSNVNLKMQTIQNLPDQEPAMRLPVFDIDVRAQRENAYTKMSQNELMLQFYGMGLFLPQNADQALMLIERMDFRGKDELAQAIRNQGIMQDVLAKVGQIAMALAQRYDPMMAQQLAVIMQGVAMDIGMQPQMDPAAAGSQKQLAPDDATEPAHDARENSIVRNAAERAANASRPS